MQSQSRSLFGSHLAAITGFLVVAAAAVLPACVAPADGDGAPGSQPAVTGTGTDRASGALSAADAAAPDSEFMITPIGRVHQSCVHAVGEGAAVDATEQVTLRSGGTARFAPCQYQVRDDRRKKAAAPAAGAQAKGPVPVTDGWAEYDSATTFTNAFGYDWINKLDGWWRVPLAPRQSAGQTVFLFTAAEPVSGNAIIQPVLQYGPSAAGGGNFWAEAVWYISSAGNVFHSSLVRVNVGDTIEGYMTGNNCTASGACTWQLTTQDGTNLSSSMSVTTTESFRWAFKGVLEVYRISNCNKLPTEGDTGATFFNVHVYMPGPSTFNFNEVTTSLGWTGTTLASGCSFGVIDTSDGVQLFWN